MAPGHVIAYKEEPEQYWGTRSSACLQCPHLQPEGLLPPSLCSSPGTQQLMAQALRTWMEFLAPAGIGGVKQCLEETSPLLCHSAFQINNNKQTL